jgi:hypothetical protein
MVFKSSNREGYSASIEFSFAVVAAHTSSDGIFD